MMMQFMSSLINNMFFRVTIKIIIFQNKELIPAQLKKFRGVLHKTLSKLNYNDIDQIWVHHDFNLRHFGALKISVWFTNRLDFVWQ